MLDVLHFSNGNTGVNVIEGIAAFVMGAILLRGRGRGY